MSSRRQVNVRFHKWPDSLHWHFQMQRLDEDEHGVWLAAPPGTTARRGSEPLKTVWGAFICLVPRHQWWTAIWNAEGNHVLYVDIATPPTWDGDTVSMFDLDLDVVQHRASGRVDVIDEDEFLDHQVRYDYPQRLIDGARAAAAKVLLALERGDEPFGTAGPERLGAWTASTRS